MKDCDVIVVGGGITGLATGLFLLQNGFKVIIIEKEKEVGGYLSAFRRGEFKFEAAVHYTYEGYPGGMVPRMLKMLGLEKEIELVRISKTRKTYTYCLPDFEITLGWDKNEFIATLCDFFPDEKEGIKKYFASLEEGFKKMTKVILERSIKFASLALDKYLEYESGKFCIKFDAVIKETKFDLLTEDYVKNFVKNEKLLALLLFVPPIPNHITCQTALSWYVDFTGLYIAKGGIDTIPKKIKKKILDMGGKILLDTRVVKVIVEHKEVKGVVTEKGEEILSDYVVFSIDVHHTFGDLVSSEVLPSCDREKLKGECIPSNFIVYLGMDRNPTELGFSGESVYVFPDYDIKKVYHSITKGLWPENNPVKVVTTSAMDESSSFAPKDKGVLILHSTAPYEYFDKAYKKSPQYYKEVKENITNMMIKTIKKIIPDIEKHILFKEAATPLTLKRFTGNHFGSMMGWMPSKDPVLLCQFNSMKTPIDRLYINGHWVYPGCGISNCLLGSYMLSKLIVKEAMGE